MSVATYNDAQLAGWGARFKSVLRSVFNAMVAAREVEARRIIAAHQARYAAYGLHYDEDGAVWR